MQESKVLYFNNLKELLIHCDETIEGQSHRAFVDMNVSLKFPILEESNLEYREIEIKEKDKNLDTISHIWNDMFEKSLHRNSIILSIGGGVVSDSVGFAASTYKRGTKLIIIPTTLLSMVDAAHGGKNGINTAYGKNQIGTFMMPNEVLICTEFLEGLPQKELKTGLIELIKAGFLRSAELVEKIYNIDINEIDEELISSAINIKNEIVNSDFKETSQRMLLNFGHTIGHLIEYDSKHRITHGEAVAIGILKALQISEKVYGLDSKVANNFEQFLTKHELKTSYNFTSDSEKLRNVLSNDKKLNNNKVKYVLLKEIADPVLIDYDLDDLLKEVIGE